MAYGVPVWIYELEKECNGKIYNRVQRLININIAKAYRPASNEALCTPTGLTPTVIQAEEEANIFNIMRESSKNEIDKDVQVKYRIHPADTVRITEFPEDEEIPIYTDGSKNDNGIAAGTATSIKGKLEHQLQ